MSNHGRKWAMVVGLLALLILTFILHSGVLLTITILLILTSFGSALYGRYVLSRVTYTRRFARSRCFVGESLGLTVELTNRKVLPVTYLSVDDTVPESLDIASRKLRFSRIGKGVLRSLFSLLWYQKVIRHYQVTPQRRGLYELGPAVIKAGDPFGFWDQSMDVDERETLICYPKIVPLEELGFPSRRPFGDLKSTDRLFEDEMRFAGVREYQVGDPLRRIHWKASAASGRLQVKLLDPSSNMGLAVFLNTWAFDLHWQGTDANVLETGCILAASIANWAVEQEVPVGVYANALTQGWSFNLHLPPARGPQVLPQVLEGLARLSIPARESIAQLLLEETPALGYGSSVVVVTGQVPLDLAAAILKVQQSGRPVTLVLIGAGPIDLPHLPGVRITHVSGEE
ncbi:MAG: DUF58 domain-containing protein, partial [Mycobacterium leprae]